MCPKEFVHQYEKALASQEWTAVEPLVHPDICVTFSNGVSHRGKYAVRHAYEQNFSLIKEEEYNITNVHWVFKNESIAVYLFEFSWTGIIEGKDASGSGRGTSVLLKDETAWKLLAEHLGA